MKNLKYIVSLLRIAVPIQCPVENMDINHGH